MQRVYIAESLVDGQLLVDHLAEADIASELFHQNIQGGLGELAVVYPEVWVKRDRDYIAAKQLVEIFSKRPLPIGNQNCPQCGESNPNTFEICWLCHSTLSVQ